MDRDAWSPQFIEAVTEMRGLQKAWFRGDKRAETLQAAKRAEKRVDELLVELSGALPGQGRLFG